MNRSDQPTNMHLSEDSSKQGAKAQKFGGGLAASRYAHHVPETVKRTNGPQGRGTYKKQNNNAHASARVNGLSFAQISNKRDVEKGGSGKFISPYSSLAPMTTSSIIDQPTMTGSNTTTYANKKDTGDGGIGRDQNRIGGWSGHGNRQTFRPEWFSNEKVPKAMGATLPSKLSAVAPSFTPSAASEMLAASNSEQKHVGAAQTEKVEPTLILQIGTGHSRWASADERANDRHEVSASTLYERNAASIVCDFIPKLENLPAKAEQANIVSTDVSTLQTSSAVVREKKLETMKMTASSQIDGTAKDIINTEEVLDNESVVSGQPSDQEKARASELESGDEEYDEEYDQQENDGDEDSDEEEDDETEAMEDSSQSDQPFDRALLFSRFGPINSLRREPTSPTHPSFFQLSVGQAAVTTIIESTGPKAILETKRETFPASQTTEGHVVTPPTTKKHLEIQSDIQQNVASVVFDKRNVFVPESAIGGIKKLCDTNNIETKPKDSLSVQEVENTRSNMQEPTGMINLRVDHFSPEDMEEKVQMAEEQYEAQAKIIEGLLKDKQALSTEVTELEQHAKKNQAELKRLEEEIEKKDFELMITKAERQLLQTDLDSLEEKLQGFEDHKKLSDKKIETLMLQVLEISKAAQDDRKDVRKILDLVQGQTRSDFYIQTTGKQQAQVSNTTSTHYSSPTAPLNNPKKQPNETWTTTKPRHVTQVSTLTPSTTIIAKELNSKTSDNNAAQSNHSRWGSYLGAGRNSMLAAFAFINILLQLMGMALAVCYLALNVNIPAPSHQNSCLYVPDFHALAIAKEASNSISEIAYPTSLDIAWFAQPENQSLTVVNTTCPWSYKEKPGRELTTVVASMSTTSPLEGLYLMPTVISEMKSDPAPPSPSDGEKQKSGWSKKKLLATGLVCGVVVGGWYFWG